MQRIILYGVPYFINGTNSLFAYIPEREPIPVGSYDPVTERVILKDGVLTTLQPILDGWRSTLTSKPRKPKEKDDSKKNGGNDSEDGSDGDKDSNTDV